MLHCLQESYPEARRLVDSGEMIPDQMVCDLLLEALLLDEPGLQDDLGFVVDGFPRTATQVRAAGRLLACDFLNWCVA
jgi:adenylate kinase family enzyme